jgi:hypothetical protein
MPLNFFTRRIDPKVTVVINNRDLVSWPREMVSRIERYTNLAGIIIVDNQSSFPPLLEWYRDLPHRVIRLDENVGHEAPFSRRILDEVPTDDFVVTDPDLGLLDTPDDTLTRLCRHLHDRPNLGKVGLSLDWRSVPSQSRYYAHCQSYERSLWQSPRIGWSGLRQAAVDTTFAIYNKRINSRYFIGGARTAPPYKARHYPWEVIDPTLEFQYYLDHASASCSFKAFAHARSH